jgi:hypothetical protein
VSHFLKARIVRDKQRPTLFYVELENPIFGQDSLWERVGPMDREEAERRQNEHTSIQNFAAQAEQTRAYQRLAKTIHKTQTPEYRAALKKQTEALAGFEPTPYPSIRLKPPSPDDSWIVQMSARPEPFTQDEIAEYQRRDREKKLRHMKAGRNRIRQPSASRAAATVKKRKAAANGERARRMRAEGATNKTIAQHLGLSVRQVQRLLKK